MAGATTVGLSAPTSTSSVVAPTKSIRKALSQLTALGLIEITRLGRRSYADLRSPSMYRLTYLSTYQDGKEVDPTHEWKKTKSQGRFAHRCQWRFAHRKW